MFPLETYLLTVNKRQGIGFKIFSVVVDKRLLKQLAIGSGLSTGLTFLASPDEEVEHGCCLRAADNATCATTLAALSGGN